MAAPHRLDIAELERRRTAWSDEWRAAANSSEPADRARAEAALTALYRASGRPAPEVRWAPSPRAAMLSWALMASMRKRVLNPWAKGDVGNGANREFNALPDPFGMEPAWTTRLEERVGELAISTFQGPGSTAVRGRAEALGISGIGRPLLAVRASLQSAELPLNDVGEPDAGAVDAAGGVLGEAWQVIVGSLGEALARDAFAKALTALMRQLLGASTTRRDALQAMQPGQWDAATPVLAAARDVFGGNLWRHREGRDEHEAAIDQRLELARSAGPWWALDDLAIVSERPLVNRTDDQGRPHAAGGPALAWPDGFAIYAWHGVVVDRSVLMDPGGITAIDIDAERNIERRRVLIEQFGAERLVREGGATMVNEDETGRLWRRVLDPGGPPWRRRDEPVVLVEVTNSTPEPDGSRRTYFLRVPPATRTAREGVAWTFGLGDVEYRPSRES